MTFDNLQKLGKEICNYYTSKFNEDEFIFFSINTKIFNQCLRSAGLNESDIIFELKNPGSYKTGNEYVNVAVAAFQVKTHFELSENNQTDLLASFQKFYETTNVYNSHWRLEDKNLQDYLWIDSRVSVLNCFKNKKLNLFTEVRNPTGKQNYDTYKYLKYPTNQLFFLDNNFYKNELIKICIRLNIQPQESFENIYTQLKLRSNYSYKNLINALQFGDTFSPDNFRKILALFINIYADSKNYSKELSDFNINLQHAAGSTLNNQSNYTFEIVKYDGRWNLYVYTRNGDFVDESDDQSVAYKYLFNSLAQNNKIKEVFVYQPQEEEYDSDSEVYVQLKSQIEDEDYETSCLLVSSEEKTDLEKFILDENFTSNNIKLYRFNSLQEYLSLTETTKNNSEEAETPLEKQIKGGIREGQGRWLLGCEPVIPEGCNITNQDFKDKPSFYRIQKGKETTSIEIIDNKPVEKIEFNSANNGWLQLGLPEVNGFNVTPRTNTNHQIDFTKVNYVKLHYGSKLSFTNLNYKGYYNGERLIAEEVKQGINYVKIYEDYCYVVKDEEKQLLKELKITADKRLLPGRTYLFGIDYNQVRNTLSAKMITIEEDKIPIKRSIVNKNFKLLYTVYNQKKIICPKRIGTNQLLFDFDYDDIVANAINLGAYAKEYDLDKDIIDTKELQRYIRFADVLTGEQYLFVIIKNCTDIISLNNILSGVLPKEFPLRLYVFVLFKFDAGISDGKKTYTITDPDFENKQQKFKLWLNYCGTSNWSKINKTCIQLLESEPEDIKNQYGNNPIYRLFYPLINNGNVDIKYINNEFVFSLSDDKSINIEGADKLYDNAILLLQQIMPAMDFIKTWQKEEYVDIQKKVYPLDVYGFKKKQGQPLCFRLSNFFSQNNYIMFKDQPNSSPHVNTYFGMFNINTKEFEFYVVPCRQYFEAKNYCQCICNVEGDKKELFTYSTSNKTLSCFDYGIIPSLIQRALNMFDPQQLSKKEIYMPYRNYQPFTNIPSEAVNLLRKIFGNNSVKVID